MSIIDKLIGSYSERQVKKLKRTVDAIEALAGHYEALSDAELAATHRCPQGSPCRGRDAGGYPA